MLPQMKTAQLKLASNGASSGLKSRQQASANTRLGGLRASIRLPSSKLSSRPRTKDPTSPITKTTPYAEEWKAKSGLPWEDTQPLSTIPRRHRHHGALTVGGDPGVGQAGAAGLGDSAMDSASSRRDSGSSSKESQLRAIKIRSDTETFLMAGLLTHKNHLRKGWAGGPGAPLRVAAAPWLPTTAFPIISPSKSDISWKPVFPRVYSVNTTPLTGLLEGRREYAKGKLCREGDTVSQPWQRDIGHRTIRPRGDQPGRQSRYVIRGFEISGIKKGIFNTFMLCFVAAHNVFAHPVLQIVDNAPGEGVASEISKAKRFGMIEAEFFRCIESGGAGTAPQASREQPLEFASKPFKGSPSWFWRLNTKSTPLPSCHNSCRPVGVCWKVAQPTATPTTPVANGQLSYHHFYRRSRDASYHQSSYHRARLGRRDPKGIPRERPLPGPSRHFMEKNARSYKSKKVLETGYASGPGFIPERKKDKDEKKEKDDAEKEKGKPEAKNHDETTGIAHENLDVDYHNSHRAAGRQYQATP
ncbi:hypothetical protein DL767_003952 [Monosporascus sp. MG133]|nr:hypothetical protein DL767_003952 [Monosporascus sp. MG133]